MKSIFMTLIFANTTLLTPHPVSFNGSFALNPGKALTAISSGAEIEIQVSSLSTNGKDDYISEWKMISDQFPIGSIAGYLIDTKGGSTMLVYEGHSSISNSDVRLMLESKGGVPTNRKFSKVIIKSKIQLSNVLIYWKNYKN